MSPFPFSGRLGPSYDVRPRLGIVADDLLLPVLAQRWSPREFDVRYSLGDAQEHALLEAARWTPSAGNSQPWSFHVVRREARGWDEIVDSLAGSSRPWAAQASALVVNLCHVLVEDSEWEYSEFAAYDLGQAVAHMTIQAHAMGLACRQFRAFDKDRLADLLEVPPHWEIFTMTAIGVPGPSARRSFRASTREDDITWPRP